MSKVLLVSEHPNIGAIVQTDAGQLVAFDKHSDKGLIDLSTGHNIKRLPTKGLFRNTNNATIQEAGEAFVENRSPRWKLPFTS